MKKTDVTDQSQIEKMERLSEQNQKLKNKILSLENKILRLERKILKISAENDQLKLAKPEKSFEQRLLELTERNNAK